jgi:hypothetical protein
LTFFDAPLSLRSISNYRLHSLRHCAGVVQCVTVQSQHTWPDGHRIVLQSGGVFGRHPVGLEPGGQHCCCMVTA